jgi:hypothetical protein
MGSIRPTGLTAVAAAVVAASVAAMALILWQGAMPQLQPRLGVIQGISEPGVYQQIHMGVAAGSEPEARSHTADERRSQASADRRTEAAALPIWVDSGCAPRPDWVEYGSADARVLTETPQEPRPV